MQFPLEILVGVVREITLDRVGCQSGTIDVGVRGKVEFYSYSGADKWKAGDVCAFVVTMNNTTRSTYYMVNVDSEIYKPYSQLVPRGYVYVKKDKSRLNYTCSPPSRDERGRLFIEIEGEQVELIDEADSIKMLM